MHALTDYVSGPDRLRVKTALRQLQVNEILDRLARADPGHDHQANIEILRNFLK
jgi:hypothetical protein